MDCQSHAKSSHVMKPSLGERNAFSSEICRALPIPGVRDAGPAENLDSRSAPPAQRRRCSPTDHRTTGGGDFWGQGLGTKSAWRLARQGNVDRVQPTWPGWRTRMRLSRSGSVVRLAFRDPTSGPAVGRELPQARSIWHARPRSNAHPRWSTSKGNPGPIGDQSAVMSSVPLGG